MKIASVDGEAPAAPVEAEAEAPVRKPRGRKPAAPKPAVVKPEQAAEPPREAQPRREESKPAREPKPRTPRKAAEPVAADDGWNGPVPGFLGQGFGT